MEQAETLERDGFVFFRSYIDALDELPQKDQLPVLKAIIRFGLDGEEPNLSGMQKAFFLLAKPNLEKSRKKAANGKKGGSKRKQIESKSKQIESENESATDLKNVCPSRIKDKGQGIKDKGQGIKDKGQGIKDADGESEASDFERFFSMYPRQDREEEAREAWEALGADDDPATADRIILSLDDWAHSNQWSEEQGKFIPSAANWLRNGTWKNFPPGGRVDNRRQLSPDELDAIRQYMQDGNGPDILF